MTGHEMFQRKEPRYRDFWLAFDGVNKAFTANNLIDAATAVAAFLKSWNWEYYRFRPLKLAALEDDLLKLVTEHLERIHSFRPRSIATLEESERADVIHLLAAFEMKLGAVGMAKALSVLATDFFPLWDNAIASAYGVLVNPRGYLIFMGLVKSEIALVNLPESLVPIKTLDEYNYCKHTKHWIS